MKIFKIAQWGPIPVENPTQVTVKLVKDADILKTPEDRGLSAIKKLLKDSINNEFTSVLSKHLNMGDNQFVMFHFEVDKGQYVGDSGTSVRMRLRAIVLKTFPTKYYPWLLEFLRKRLQSFGATILDIKESSSTFGEETYFKYDFLFKVPLLSLEQRELQSGVSIVFPDVGAFYEMASNFNLFGGPINGMRVLDLQQVWKHINGVKDSARAFGKPLLEYLLWVAERMDDGPKKHRLKVNAVKMVEYVEKLETLKGKSAEYGLNSLLIIA